MSQYIDRIDIQPSQWVNVHAIPALTAAGLESGDQLLISVLGGGIRYHFGDTEPTGQYGFNRDKEFITLDGTDCWVIAIGRPATIQVEYAP